MACLALDIPLDHVTIDATYPHIRCGRHPILERQAIVALAGPAAEEMVFGWPLPDGVDTGDVANARRYLVPMYADSQIQREIRRLRDTAAVLVRQPRSRRWIETIAQALLDSRTLSGDEINVLLST